MKNNFSLTDIKEFLKEHFGIDWNGKCRFEEEKEMRKATNEDFNRPVYIEVRDGKQGLLSVDNTSFVLAAYNAIMYESSDKWMKKIESKQLSKEYDEYKAIDECTTNYDL